MPHRDFGSANLAGQRLQGVTFTLVGERFTVQDPSLGDVFELHDAPEVRLDDQGRVQFSEQVPSDLELVRSLARFLERIVPLEDRHRLQRAMFSIPASRGDIVIEAAMWLAAEVAGHPFGESASSAGGP